MSPSRPALDPVAEDETDRGSRSDESALPRGISGLGIALCLVVLGEWVVFAQLRPEIVLSPMSVTGFLSNAPFLVVLVYGGYWLNRSDLPSDRHLRIAGWCFGAMLGFLALNLLLILSTPIDTLWELVGWIRWAMAIGAGFGLLIGIIEARAIERERMAERATARADYAESQRELFDYLNGLLRHEVLNTSNVISGRTTLLLEDSDLDESVRGQLAAINRQSESLTEVIRDVRVLLAATNGETTFEPTDLGDVLRDEVESLHDRYDGVQTDLDVPEDLTVLADDLLPRLFSNLIANAVKHNDGDSPRVRITGTADGDAAVVRIADDGPGIADEERETLFERDPSRSDTHGLGLYLVGTLAARYGGDVELTDTGPDGTTFTVELPLADTEDSDSSGTDRAAAVSAVGPSEDG